MDARSPTTTHRRRLVGACLAVAVVASLSLAALAGALGGATAAQQSIAIETGRGTVAVTGADALVGGLTKITVRNTRRADANFFLLRLRPGKTLADLQAATNRSAAIPEDVIEILTGSSVGPGQTFTTTVNLPEGAYVAATPPDGRGLGPFQELAVGPGAAGGSPPKTVGRVVMFDHGFRAPATMKGRGTLAVENAGQNFHFIVGIRLNRGVNADRVREQLIEGTLRGAPPGEFVSIIGVVGPATTNYVETRLKPGTYLIACFFGDRHSGGHEHTEFGMVRKIVVR